MAVIPVGKMEAAMLYKHEALDIISSLSSGSSQEARSNSSPKANRSAHLGAAVPVFPSICSACSSTQ